MPAPHDSSRLSVTQFAERFRGDMIPLSGAFSYFCASMPMPAEDLRDYLEEPISALPPALAEQLSKISILLVPYLSKSKPGELVSMEKPPEDKLAWAAHVKLGGEIVLAFGLKDQDVAEYHYRFYNQLATIIADKSGYSLPEFLTLIRDELQNGVHGEVDEDSWRAKQSLLRRPGKVRLEGKAFLEYARAAFIDTLTLYLHGICCDIDVDAGPRQIPSRFLRKRLVQMKKIFPPPTGFVVLPEDMK